MKQVRLRYTWHDSCLSNSQKHSTAPTAAPQHFAAVVTTAFEVDLSWSPPVSDKQNGVITNYVINITEDESGDDFQESTSSTSLSVEDNLRPYITYTCVISAGTSAGQGPFSSAINFTTHEHGRFRFSRDIVLNIIHLKFLVSQILLFQEEMGSQTNYL